MKTKTMEKGVNRRDDERVKRKTRKRKERSRKEDRVVRTNSRKVKKGK